VFQCTHDHLFKLIWEIGEVVVTVKEIFGNIWHKRGGSKNSKSQAPNHHKAICPKRSASRRESVGAATSWGAKRGEPAASSNAAKENTKTKAEKEPW
jgi:hypothetical protein